MANVINIGQGNPNIPLGGDISRSAIVEQLLKGQPRGPLLSPGALAADIGTSGLKAFTLAMLRKQGLKADEDAATNISEAFGEREEPGAPFQGPLDIPDRPLPVQDRAFAGDLPPGEFGSQQEREALAGALNQDSRAALQPDPTGDRFAFPTPPTTKRQPTTHEIAQVLLQNPQNRELGGQFLLRGRDQERQDKLAEQKRAETLAATERAERFKTSERKAGQRFRSGERLGGEQFKTGERTGGQGFRKDERVGGEKFKTSERIAGEKFKAKESVKKFKAEAKKGTKALTIKPGVYGLPDGTKISHSQLMSQYRLDNNLLDGLGLKILEITNPERAAIEREKIANAKPFDKWAESGFGVDVRGGFDPDKIDPTPTQMPATEQELIVGKTYQTERGLAVWDGKMFKTAGE